MTGSVPRTTMPIHGTTRYIRTHLAVKNGVLKWEVPQTFLGMFQIGSRMVDIPMSDVATVDVRRFVIHPFRLAVGLALVITPWVFLPWWLSVPLLILGLWAILNTLGPHLEVVTKAGPVRRAPICFGHSLDAELYQAAVADMLEES